MKGIRILSKVDGFRRAGLAHTGSRDYPLTDFTAKQLEQLRGEPNLVAVDIDMPDEAVDDKPPAKAKTAKTATP